MSAIKKKFLFFSHVCLLAGLFFFVPLTAMASEVEALGNLTTIPQYVSYILSTMMLFAEGLSVLVIVIGGVYWLVSLGRSKFTSEGKEWVKAGILGLVLIVCSQLIITTINPKIFSFTTISFFGVPILIITPTPPTPPGPVPNISFDEIPIGTLTENLLTKGIDCYDFDANGEPIDGDPNTLNIWEPTLTNHDRLDCIIKLSEALDKKGKIFSALSEKIAALMDTCECDGIKCGLDCATCSYDSSTCPRDSFDIGSESPCSGDCINSKCTGGDCCSADTKDLIEHGPITLNPPLVCNQEEYWGLDEFRTLITTDSDVINIAEVEEEIDGENIKIIDKDVWQKDIIANTGLRLIDKVKYFKEKIKELKESINPDLTALKDAKSKLNNDCYFGSSAVKFLVDSASTSKNSANITINNSVDNSKYCEGFGYSNSSCFYYCQNVCNPISEEGQNCFKECANTDSDPSCPSDCINNQGCISGSGYTTFNGTNDDGEQDPNSCLSSCQGDGGNCSNSCDKKYANCPLPVIQNCKDQCQTDSESLTANRDRTYLATYDIEVCAKDSDNFLEYKRCAEFALRGRYCSKQNPGDPDVFKNPTYPKTTMPTTPPNGYSSLYFYQTPAQQKCPQCVQGTNHTTGVTIPGVQTYQECWKGPSCSYIPEAPCTDVDGKCTPASTINLDLLNCNGTCEKFSYSGDPLTFYCANGVPGANWIKEKWQLYDEMICQKNTEVPVGQTVDGAITWAEDLKELAQAVISKAENMILYIKAIGEEPPANYCRCDSVCAEDLNTCKGSCTFNQTETDNIWLCSCSTNPCAGSSCKNMINQLLPGESDTSCPGGKGVVWYSGEISTALQNLKNLTSRSDVLKRLNYSREKMDENSVKIKITPNKTLSTFSCYQVQKKFYPTIVNGDVVIGDEKIKGYCYGRTVSGILQPDNLLLDNWFSCEKQIQEK